MISATFNIVLKSVSFYKKPVLYQVLIIALLCAVITGSLLTGRSVRTSLKRSAAERLGNTGILISSGIRSFDAELGPGIREKTGINTAGIYELNGYCQSLNSQKGAFNSHIFAIDNNFFSFQGNDSIVIKPGEIAVNQRLADYLGVKAGDDLILRFNEISDIPPDAPFYPASEAGRSVVMKIGRILHPAFNGNFSLSISQMVPMNIFMNLSDLETGNKKPAKINRLLIDRMSEYPADEIYSALKKTLTPSDIGLRVRKVVKTGGYELISDRIFIDDAIVKEISKRIPSSAPVITYLGNRITAGSRSTPYSFVSALPGSVYPEIGTGKSAVINKWLADDLSLNVGDSVGISWYAPDSLDKLIERDSRFVISRVVDIEGIWSDSLLMPEFPGIAGSSSCSEWEAGVPIKMGEIREKDEDYWNKYGGTPKAFINYEMGKELWGNNFGPATAIRFPEGLTESEIIGALTGSLDPSLTGFTLTDLAADSVKAANESVDFGTLFLSLGFFLILASVVLLSFAVSSYFDTKKGQIRTLFALGFKNRWIKQYLFIESSIISFIGCFIGAFAGYLVNIVITMALNSVWQGAVQTDTLKAFFSFVPLLTGFVSALFFSMVFMRLKVNRYLTRLNQKQKEIYSIPSSRTNLIFLIASAIITISLYVSTLLPNVNELGFYFAAGTFLLITFILLVRQYCLRTIIKNTDPVKHGNGLSRLYYSFYPGYVVTPVLFIAAGIFAVFITGTNRMDFNEKHMKRSEGTGGYLFWCENTIPVKEDLNTARGKIALGFDSDSLSGMRFVGIKRSSGNDASCLNLNHITAPPLLGIDPADFIARESFSFSKVISGRDIENPWQYLNVASETNTVYGIADQTVLDWGLKIKPGDTLTLRAENGQPLNIIIAAGLQSSVFQGYLLIGKDNFIKHYPSISGSSILLVDGNPAFSGLYERTLNERLENYGVNIEKTTTRLASFYQVTNTYLSVFGVFGVLGMITGIGGLGFVLLRNYNQRKREFALMLAIGFSFKRIRRIVLSEQIMILTTGILSGVISAIAATFPTLKRSQDIPWQFLLFMVLTVMLTGLLALFLSVRAISEDSLTASLKKE
jgi:ABC-type antimicrobial peptide transport system permease subunit